MTDGFDHEFEPSDLERLDAATSPPSLIGAAAMLKLASTETKFLVHRAIPASAITLVMGEPGCGKSWFCYGLAMAVARGESWISYPVCEAGSVLVLNYDNPTNECGRRFLRLGMRDDDRIFFHTYQDTVEMLRLPKHAEELRAIVAKVLPSLILVDSFRQAHDCDENSSEKMAIVMRELKSLATMGAAVVALHHTPKGGDTAATARGSGEIFGSADCALLLTGSAEEDGRALVTYKKARSWKQTRDEVTNAFEVKDKGARSWIERIDPGNV